jgi:hypothetical protein
MKDIEIRKIFSPRYTPTARSLSEKRAEHPNMEEMLLRTNVNYQLFLLFLFLRELALPQVHPPPS